MSKKKQKKNAPAGHEWVWLLIISLLILGVVILLVWLLVGKGAGPDSRPTKTDPTTNHVKIENPEKVNIDLGYGMEIVDVAKYTGVYVEDGSNDVVSGLLMIVVKNKGTQDIQYAEIEMPVGDQIAYFKLSSLPVGESAVVLEQNRMAYTDQDFTKAISKNVVHFKTAMSLCKDKLEIQTLSGVINVKNISGEDITGDIVLYYKNSSTDMLYGGITYRCVITGGLKNGEIKQLQAQHFRTSGSRIMFVTCG